MALVMRHASRAFFRLSRLGVAVVLSLGLVIAVSACGMHVQTNRPYTPGEGVNADLGSVQIRNLMILSRAKGSGFLSATLTSSSRDALVGVSGTAIKVDGSAGSAFKATVANPVALGSNRPVVLTDRSPITVRGADLVPGLTANVVLEFSTAGQLSIAVPVVDANQPDYATISPIPSPSL